jgi:8-oxo-dGTP diphosphatase
VRESAVVIVVAAIIEERGRFLLARRLAGTHLAGTWEFPGGKCESGETHEACLARELREELGVDAVVGEELLVTEHAYPTRTVRLHFRRCALNGVPRAMLGQQIRWASPGELRSVEFPAADREVVELLTGQSR